MKSDVPSFNFKTMDVIEVEALLHAIGKIQSMAKATPVGPSFNVVPDELKERWRQRDIKIPLLKRRI